MDTNFSFDQLKTKFNEAGFSQVGAVDFDRALPLYQEHASRYQKWIENNSHGSMEYLKRGLDRRLDPKLVFPNLKSVITVARSYDAQAVEENGLRYARYLNEPDYHETLKLDLANALKDVPFQYKICVDTSAVLERTWGALTGLGWIGKNTLLIHPQLGSFFFIAVIFTDLVTDRDPLLLKDYCGSCTRCLEACPTKALSSHYLESEKCISYLTLEKRGEWTIDRLENANSLTAGYLAGCDLCQNACPYNIKPQKVAPEKEKANHLVMNEEMLLAETEEQYKMRVKGTALSRVKFADFKRNLHEARKR